MKLFAITIKHPLRGIQALHADVLALNSAQALVSAKDEFIRQYCKRFNTVREDIPVDFWEHSISNIVYMDRAQVQSLTYVLTSVPEG